MVSSSASINPFVRLGTSLAAVAIVVAELPWGKSSSSSYNISRMGFNFITYRSLVRHVCWYQPFLGSMSGSSRLCVSSSLWGAKVVKVSSVEFA